MQLSYKEFSPAKINLFLKIVSKRDDGYHNIRSGITLINLFDEVIAEKDEKFSVKYIGDFAPLNKIFKDCIVEKIFSKLHIRKPKYSFTIKKNIPIMAGLGSASSNAAAVLRILQKLKYLDLKKENFAKIGADVPFFFNNHDSLIREIGNITIRQSFPKYFFLLIKPVYNCSTKEIYNLIKPNNINYNENNDTNLINDYDNGNDFESILGKLSNEINNLLKFMRSLPDAIFTGITGSGSCIFTAYESRQAAEESLATFTKQFPLLWAKVLENNFNE